MDPRGLTTDPFREGQPLSWWETVGGSQSPSPYAEETWIAYQDTFSESYADISGSLTKVTYGVIKVYDYYASHSDLSQIITDTAVIEELSEEERGTPLGQLSYELQGGLLRLTSWSHYGWHNAAPVRKAWRALQGSLSECVVTVVVKDDPTAFWTALGFYIPFKGSPDLVYDRSNFEPIPY